MNRMDQSSPTMRLLRFWLVIAGASLTALSQTNAPSNVRQLSLQDAIELALEHNLDLQIDRYNPRLALYTVRVAYGDYDPKLSLSGEHDHSETGSRLLSGGFSIPGSTSDADVFSGG